MSECKNSTAHSLTHSHRFPLARKPISTHCVTMEENEDLTCPICLSVFQGACSTNCGHTYCAECLIQFLESHRGRARHQLCAICRATIFNATPSFALRNLANQALRAQGQQPLSEQRQRELDALLPSTAVPAFPASVRAPPLSLSLSHSRSLSCATRESSNDSRKSATIQRSHSLID